MFLCYCIQEALHFSVTWIEVYTVHILVTLLHDGNCTDHMHVISYEYIVCTNVLLKIDVFKLFYVPGLLAKDRHQTVGHPTVRMALQDTFPQNFKGGALLNKSQMNLPPVLLKAV